MLINGLLVFLGGGIGSLLRYIVNLVTQIYTFNHIGTLLVNTIGSLNNEKLKAMNQKIYSSFNYQKPKVIMAHTNKNKHTLRFELLEGKNREIRNICEIFNLKVEKLKRISFGKFFLKTVPHANYKVMQINESY